MHLESIEECLKKILLVIPTPYSIAYKNYGIASWGGVLSVRLALADRTQEEISDLAPQSNEAFVYDFFNYPNPAPLKHTGAFYQFFENPPTDFFKYSTAQELISAQLSSILNAVLENKYLNITPELRNLITLVQKSVQIPNYIFQLNNSYKHQNGNRMHFFTVDYNGNDGDMAKTAILKEFEDELNAINDTEQLTTFKENLEQDERYKILRTGQGITTRLLNLFCHFKTTSSERALMRMLDQKDELLQIRNIS